MTKPSEIVTALARLRSGKKFPAAEIGVVMDRRLEASRAKRRWRTGRQPNLMAMIDVTFLLLVFFVCTTRVLDKERLLRADLSEQAGVSAHAALSLDDPPLRIEVQSNNGTML